MDTTTERPASIRPEFDTPWMCTAASTKRGTAVQAAMERASRAMFKVIRLR